MKIIGITRVRNEAHIIGHTLNHVSGLVNEILVYDDASTDETREICFSHPKVKNIIVNPKWEPDPGKRRALEGSQRQIIYERAASKSPDWIYYFDADEFADFEGIDFSADAYKLRLFDFYITEEDKTLPWQNRKWIGPEFRDILMLFKPHKQIYFTSRVPKMPASYQIKNAGYVKHYGKAISIEEWNLTCEYYINHLNEKGIKERWKARRGKAVHARSDFGNQLITWEERKTKGFKLII